MGDVVITGAPGKKCHRDRPARPAEASRDAGGRGVGSELGAALVVGVALAVLLALTACRSGSAGRSAETPGAEPPAQGEVAEQPAESPVEQGLIEVTGVAAHEGAPGSIIEITSNEPLVWTSYRDADGNVVVELPNTIAPGVGDVVAEDGLVSTVQVEEDRSGRRPLTRVVVGLLADADRNLRAEGNRLILEIVPVDGEPAPSLAFEPIAEEEPEPADEPAPVFEPAPAQERMAQQQMAMAEPEASGDLGTPERPVAGPPARGVRASTLRHVDVQRADDVTVVEISGDGEFEYSTFHLGQPERFVVDLVGVVIGQGSSKEVPVGSDTVDRVRLGQFKPFPDPVSRVVFDLNDEPRPSIERTSDSLIVRFRGAGAAMETAAAEPAPMMREPEPEPEPMAMREPEPEPMAMPEPEPMAEPAAMPMAEPMARTEPAPAMADRGEAMETRMVESAPRPKPPAATSDAGLFAAEDLTPGGRSGSESTIEGPVFGARTVSAEKRYFGEPIDMTLKDADVVETLRSFAKISGLNIVIQPDVSGRVTVELHEVPWDQALEQILKINGLGYEVEGNIMRIATLKTLSDEAVQKQALEQANALSRPLDTVMKRLSYTNASSVAGILQGRGGGNILSPRGSVIVDERTNTLIISELPEFMDTVLAIVENLDEPEPQVVIEARIIETTKRFSRSLGVAWGFDLASGPATGNSTGLVFPNNLDATGSVNLGTAGDNGLLSLRLGNILNTFQLDAVLNAAEQDGLVNILSTPKVTTLNNHQAVIQSGIQVPIQTVANNTVTVQYVNATLRLEVTPQITADGTVVMDLRIQKREVQTAFVLPGATNAPIATREAETQVLVRDGGTAVIGGIYQVSTDQGENRVPGLSNIPILGHLFRNRDRTDENEELLIFITPRVVRL